MNFKALTGSYLVFYSVSLAHTCDALKGPKAANPLQEAGGGGTETASFHCSGRATGLLSLGICLGLSKYAF